MKKLTLLFAILAALLVPASHAYAATAARVYFCYDLTGGGTGALDKIDGTALKNQDLAVVPVPDDKVYYYWLDADSGLAESSPDVITPDTNAGDKRWILIPGGSGLTQEQVEDYFGAMLSGNMETFIAVSYQDDDGTVDFVVPVKDEDTMVSDSDTHLATQQSIKAYVDGKTANSSNWDTAYGWGDHS